MRLRSGFTLLELMVVISIIGIMTAVIVGGFSDSREQSRDAQRQSDVRLVQIALEQYRNKYGLYPEGCNGPMEDRSGGGVNTSGEWGTDHECPTASEDYIVALAPEFIPNLPRSRPAVSANAGYVYVVNRERSVYKFLALNVVEADVISNAVRAGDGSFTSLGHEFHRCGSDFDPSYTDMGNSFDDAEMCEETPTNDTGNAGGGASALNGCSAVNRWRTTYAVSGGYATPLRTNNLGNNSPERA